MSRRAERFYTATRNGLFTVERRRGGALAGENGTAVHARTRGAGARLEACGRGLPGANGYVLVYHHALEVDRTGPATGNSTGGLWARDNGDEHWTLLNARLPPVNAIHFDATS